MTVKEYLMQIILYDTRLKQKKLKLQRMREDCYSAKGLDTSKEKVHNSLSNGYNRIDKMVDYESKIKKDVENLFAIVTAFSGNGNVVYYCRTLE